MEVKKENKRKLDRWQTRLATAQSAWDEYAQAFDKREAMVKGDNEITPCCEGDMAKEAYHVRNIVAELIESQVDTVIPQPQVTARHKKDEHLAKIVEDMLIDELNRMPMEVINDMMERTVPIQGGAFVLLEWDNSLITQDHIGDTAVQFIHPKQVVPQEGVFSSIEDMDYIFLKLPQTKGSILARYGVDVSLESEEEPEIRSSDAESSAPDMVTQYVAYYRNTGGGIGKFSWVNDTILEDLDDCQARQLRRCKKCGALEPIGVTPLDRPSLDGTHPTEERTEEPEWMDKISGDELTKKAVAGNRVTVCPHCGSKDFEDSVEEYEEIYTPFISSRGVEIPGAKLGEETDAEGNVQRFWEPARIPYYKPNIYPVIMQKSVSIFGQLLGDSDVDKIASQQNTSNRIGTKMLDKLLKAGSFATLPADANIRTDNEDMKYIRLENPADKAMIDVFNMQASIEQDLSIYHMMYEEARQIIGITDSFQGRQDPTATSGKAKEFAAQQSAGRLESKRVMKEAAYQQFFEAMFKFRLAYADEPRSIVTHSPDGKIAYEVFDRYDFLKQDADGEFYWNDQFLFTVDSSTPLATDREAMWQETRMNLQTGAFGDPTNIDTIILFWTKMEDLHYPGAKETKAYLEAQKETQAAMAAQQMQIQRMMMAQQEQAKEAEIAANTVADVLKGGSGNGNSKKAEEKNANQRPS